MLFYLVNNIDTVSVCHNELREKLKTWARENKVGEKRIRQIWSATWEAIQNAIKFGSQLGDVIRIRFSPSSDEGILEIEIEQPLIWEDWDKRLGERKKAEIKTNRILHGGTFVMLLLADEIRVTDLGRKITMSFSHEIVNSRKVAV